MTQTATITTKRQLTLPAKIFRQAGLKTGQKVTVALTNHRLVITPATALVERLAGSLPLPKKWKRKHTRSIIATSKKRYWRRRRG